MKNYDFNDLVQAYSKLGVTEGRIVYVIADVWEVRGYDRPGSRNLIEAHVEALQSLIGQTGTLVVSTASMNLCNTEIAFDPTQTPSFQRGALSEHVRQLDGALRSFHPFNSYAAIGAQAEELVANVSKGAWGSHTPEARMVELDALTVCLGVTPHLSTTVHLIEQHIGVPYRYNKEFLHPVLRNGTVSRESFYLLVVYKDCGLTRDGNRKLVSYLSDLMEFRETTLGRRTIYSYDNRDFYTQGLKAFTEDIYIWCDTPPTDRPYRE
ncbi:MAG: hypothetical protein CL569_16435 [Alphaproteobacteria bacterium]|nr:hypothetical protein [Alphaproteobacteria bacterium]|tara:strand:- start:35184 stop:35981 length:798 start_codon:yes stop_codon:yes gene_type:complete